MYLMCEFIQVELARQLGRLMNHPISDRTTPSSKHIQHNVYGFRQRPFEYHLERL